MFIYLILKIYYNIINVNSVYIFIVFYLFFIIIKNYKHFIII